MESSTEIEDGESEINLSCNQHDSKYSMELGVKRIFIWHPTSFQINQLSLPSHSLIVNILFSCKFCRVEFEVKVMKEHFMTF